MAPEPQPHRPPRVGGRIAAVVLAVACVSGTAMAAARLGRADDEMSTRPAPVRATGRVDAMYPGRVRMMKVRVSNLGSRELRLVSVRATVRRPAAGCRARSLIVRRFRGSVRLPATSTVVIRMRTRMRRSAGDGCQGVRYPLSFSVGTVPA